MKSLNRAVSICHEGLYCSFSKW